MEQSPENHIGYMIHKVSHSLKQIHNEKFEREGLTLSQARVLIYLYRKNGATQSELYKELGIKPSSITKLLDVLVQKGLVKREASQQDARINRIFLTEQGRYKEERLWEIIEEVEAQIRQTIPKDQIESFAHLLKQVRNAL
jgi:DNA-binding MarR family transcriptional regulator